MEDTQHNDSLFLKTGINISRFLIYSAIFILLSYLVFSSFDLFQYEFAFLYYLILNVIVIYFFSSCFINYYLFYNDRFELYFPTKVFGAKWKMVKYDDLEKVVYQFVGGAVSQPKIIMKRKKTSKLGLMFPNPLNSIQIYSYRRKRYILLKLKRFGIKVEVKSILKKDKNILD